MVSITIISTDDSLARYANQVGALGMDNVHKALARAVNRVTTTVHGRIIRAVAKQSSIPTAIVRGAVQKRLVSPNVSHGSSIEGVVYGTGSPLPLKIFGARQFSWGVRAKVWGRVQRFPGTYIYAGTYRSGQAVGAGHVFHRQTSASTPMELMYGPSVPEEMVKDGSKRTFETTVVKMLPERVAHELARLLPS